MGQRRGVGQGPSVGIGMRKALRIRKDSVTLST
jgi:hypothetical protein